MATQEEIFDKVRETLVDALGVDDDEVTPEATLIEDLGAESIDFLDIVFRLERNFDIKIPRGELFPENLASADSGFRSRNSHDALLPNSPRQYRYPRPFFTPTQTSPLKPAKPTTSFRASFMATTFLITLRNMRSPI